MHAIIVNQSHDGEVGCVHNDVYTVNPRLTCWVWAPRRTRHPPPNTRRKTRCRQIEAYITDVRAERWAPRDVTNLQKGGGVVILKLIKRKRKRLESSFLISHPRRILAWRTQRERSSTLKQWWPWAFKSCWFLWLKAANWFAGLGLDTKFSFQILLLSFLSFSFLSNWNLWYKY